MVVFRALGEAELRQIVEIELRRVQERILNSGAASFAFQLTEVALEQVLADGTDSRYGARHLRRAIDRLLVQPISNLLATEQVRRGDCLRIDSDPESREMVFLRQAENLSPLALARLAQTPVLSFRTRVAALPEADDLAIPHAEIQYRPTLSVSDWQEPGNRPRRKLPRFLIAVASVPAFDDGSCRVDLRAGIGTVGNQLSHNAAAMESHLPHHGRVKTMFRRWRKSEVEETRLEAGEITVHVVPTSKQLTVAVAGRVTVDSSPHLRSVLLGPLRRGTAPVVVIDLSALSYLDMSGIATLLEALKAARESSVKLRLAGMSGQARALAEIAQLDTIYSAWGAEVEFR